MRQDRLLRALRGEPTDRTPIWLMRQAGRHLPGYRALRARHNLLDLVRVPELAAEVALEPLRRYEVDAGIVFADISIPFSALGVPFSIDAGVGPVVSRPLRTPEDVEGLSRVPCREAVPFVGRAIQRFLELERDRPIVGFAGGPFTLASYLVEGRSSREFAATKRFLYQQPHAFDRLLDRLAELTIDYLRFQAESGASVLQLFDSWLGAVGSSTFERHLAEPTRRIFDAVRPLGRPTIHFSTGSGHLLEAIARTGPDALGVDWREPLSSVRRRVGARLALQGNLDPGALLGPSEVVLREARSVLAEIPDGQGHVFNLGHGVLPETDPERVAELVAFVHNAPRPGPG